MVAFIPTYKDYFDKLQDFKNNDYDFYDEVDIKEFEYNEKSKIFTYPCPCGDLFEISLDDILENEEVARCPSCSLIIRIIYEESDIEKYL